MKQIRQHGQSYRRKTLIVKVRGPDKENSCIIQFELVTWIIKNKYKNCYDLDAKRWNLNLSFEYKFTEVEFLN